MKSIIYLSLILFTCISACDFNSLKKEKDTGNGHDKGTTVVRKFFKDGKLKSEITVKGNLRHGVTKNFDRNGKLLSEVNYSNNKKNGLTINYYTTSGKVHSKLNYINGVKNGESFWYYENGEVYRVNPFLDGKLNGIQKYYHDNGQLMAEVPYKDGLPGTGLKEYTKEGKLVTDYPEIVFKEIDQIAISDKFTLTISLSKRASKVNFYIDELDEGKYLKKYMFEIPTKRGVATKVYEVPPGFVKIQKLNIVAKMKTEMGYPYITQRVYNLALQH
jgi:antitoxin component YwqK of YwqJK toxin-antitoxin module